MTHPNAEDRFVQWLEERSEAEGGTQASFEALVAQHPELDAELRLLHSDWRVFEPLLAGAVPGSIDVAPYETLPPTDEAPGKSPFPVPLPEGNRYRFRGVIGRGGGGVVLKVWDTKLDRPLAMKIVLGRGETAPTANTPFVGDGVVSRFIDEARIASQLDHPGIVPVHELGRDANGRAYFTMRLVQGEDLSQIFQHVWAGEPGWTQARVLGMLVRVCEAVAFAHERGVLHRDLKPANVMVGRHGEVHVMDWGLARARADTSELNEVRSLRDLERGQKPESPLLTGSGDILGTPAYMAPEQARGDIEALDERTDVYALGAMLYELLAARPPYVQDPERDSPLDVFLRIGEGALEPLAAVAPRAAPPLAAITARAMAREPSDRYAGVGDLGAELQSFLDGQVVGAYESGSWAELRRWVGRNRAVAAASLLAVTLVVGALVQARRQQARLESSLYAASIARAAHHFIQSDYPAMRRMLDSVAPSSRGLEWRLLNALQDSSVVRYTGSSAYPLAVGFTHDGERLVSVHGDDSVHVYETWSGTELAWFSVSGAHEAPPVFSADGTCCALLVGDGDVEIWGLDGVRVARWAAPAAEDFSVEALHFVDEGAVLISAGDQVTRWNFKAGEVQEACSWNDGRFHAFAQNIPRAVRRSNTGNSVVNLEDGSTVVELDLEFDEDEDEHEHGYSKFALDANGSCVLAYRDDSEETTVWNTATGKVRVRTKGYPADHAMQPDGSTILVHDDGDWRLVDCSDGSTRMRLATDSLAPRGLILPSGFGFIHSTAPRYPLKVARPRRRSYKLRGHDGFAVALAFHNDGSHVVAGAPEGTLRLYRIDGDSAAIECDGGLRWPSVASTRLPVPRVALYERGTLEVLSGATLERVGSTELKDVPESANRLAGALDVPLVFVHDGRTVYAIVDVVRHELLSAESTGAVSIEFDRATGRGIAKGAQARWLLSMAFDRTADASAPMAATSRGLQAIPTVDAQEMLTPIRLVTGDSQAIWLEGHRGSVDSVAFSSCGDRLLSSGDDGLRIWRVDDGAMLMHLPPQSFALGRETFGLRIALAEALNALLAVTDLGNVRIIPLRPAQERYRFERSVAQATVEACALVDHTVAEAGTLQAAIPHLSAAAPIDGPLRVAIFDEITRRCCAETE